MDFPKQIRRNKMSTQRTLLSLGIVLAAIVALSGNCPAADDSAAKLPFFAGTPLAKLITGNIGRLLVLRSELNLTDEQRSKLVATVKTHRDEIRPAVRDVVNKRRALRQAVLAQPSDPTAIRKAADDLGKTIGEAALLASKVIKEARQHLTDAQIERIRQFGEGRDKSVDQWLNEIGNLN